MLAGCAARPLISATLARAAEPLGPWRLAGDGLAGIRLHGAVVT